MKISVCIPMYNEASIIADNARKLWQYMEENFVTSDGMRDYEIIYSNDGLIFYTGDHYETFEQLYGEG